MFNVTPLMLDLVLAGVVVEFIALSFLLARMRARFLIWPLFLFLASGSFLLSAARFVLASADGKLVALTLLASFITHIALLAWAARRFFQRAGDHSVDGGAGNGQSISS